MRSIWGIKSFFALIFFIGVIALVMYSMRDVQEEYTTFTVRQGSLDIKVLEGGNVEALENQEVKSQVRGYPGTKILSIVEEGIYITEEDVKNKKVLVELDSSALVDKLTTSEISFKGTQASLTEALKGHDIQVNKSQSEIYASELETKFARLEMEKYLGTEVTAIVLDLITEEEPIIKEQPTVSENVPEPVIIDPRKGESASADAKAPKVEEPPVLTIEDLRLGHPEIMFSEFVEKEQLGDGGASQELSKLTSSEKLADADLGKANTDLDGKIELFKKKFITEQEKRTAELSVAKQEANLDAAQKALQIFIHYEFPKQAEKLMSDYIQARRKLQRTEQLALSQIAQANAKMASAQARYQIEEKRIEDYREQIEVCIMVAERAGLVVYGGEGSRYWNSEPIKEGATIRERQAIITIPDMTTMAVKVNIHESDIKKISAGLRARIRVDAFPDRKLEGEVTKVAVLPNAENRWMNPDLKVYETTIKIEGVFEWLKPGMSAETEILISHLKNTLYIPLQSVVPRGKKLVCFVIENGVPVERVIEPGGITIEYITVKSGLKVGEKVLIRPPEGSRKDETDEEATESTDEESEGSDVTDDAGKEGAKDADVSTDEKVDTPAVETSTKKTETKTSDETAA